MCKGTEVTVLANARSILIRLAKLGLVHFRVIKLFHPIVGESARVALRAILLFRLTNPRAELTAVSAELTSSIFLLIVIKGALLLIVVGLRLKGAFLSFENFQV